LIKWQDRIEDIRCMIDGQKRFRGKPYGSLAFLVIVGILHAVLQ
jgi:hypothetical protein